jgi:hypothetical protein
MLKNVASWSKIKQDNPKLAVEKTIGRENLAAVRPPMLAKNGQKQIFCRIFSQLKFEKC